MMMATAAFAFAFTLAAAAFAFVAMMVFEHNELAIDFAKGGGSVAFIGVDVHRKGVFRGDADDGVAEDGSSAFTTDHDGDDVTILDAEILGILWGHVNMTLGDDDAFFEVDFAGWALKGALAGTSDIAGFANRGG